MTLALCAACLVLFPPKTLSGHAGAQVGNKIYVVGGMGHTNTGSFFPTLWKVDPVKGQWTELAKMKVARAMAAGAAIGDALYVAGGMEFSGQHLSSVERYDLKTGHWADVAPMIHPRSRFALVALDGKLYAVSGMRGVSTGDLNTPLVESYDPRTDKWTAAGSLHHPRHGFATTIWRGHIYVFGGNDASSEMSAECWDPKTGKSEDLPDMTLRRGFHGVVVRGGLLVNFGGRPAGRQPSAYDPAARKWTDLPGPDLECNRFVYGEIGGKVWLVGGESLTESLPIVQAFGLK